VVESKYVKVDGVNTHYLVGGDGSPVILVHGAGAGVFDWRFTVVPLCQHHRVYAPDMVGFGHSDKPKTDYTVHYCVDFLERFMDAVQVDRASLVGACSGGTIALGLAIRSPQRIEKLVLAGSGSLGKSMLGGILYSLPSFLLLALFKPRRSIVRLAYETGTQNHEWITDALVEEAYELQNMPGATYARVSIYKNFGSFGGQRIFFPNKLPLVTAPTLIIWGEKDSMFPVTHAENAHRLIKNSQVSILQGCGHIVSLQMPDRFSQLVLDFIK